MQCTYICVMIQLLCVMQAAGRAGKLFIFHSALSTGDLPGALKNREDAKLFGSDKEKVTQSIDNLYNPFNARAIVITITTRLILF